MLLAKFYVATLVTVQLLELVTAVQGPVIIWNIKKEQADVTGGMGTVTSQQFAEIVQPLAHRTTVVAFSIRNLTRADMRCKKPVTGNACLEKVSGYTPRLFLNDVQDAKSTLWEVSANRTTIQINKGFELSSAITCSPGTVNFLTFNDGEDGPNSPKILMKLDSLMSRVFGKNQCSPAIFLLMADEPISTNETGITMRTARTMFIGKHFVLHVKEVQFKKSAADAAQVVDVQSILTESDEKQNITVTLETNSEQIVFTVTKSNGYFEVEKFKYGQQEYKLADVTAPLTMSYYASHLVSEGNDGSTFEWSRFQIQVRHPPGKPGDKFKFSAAWHHVGFFTAAILSGLMVTALLGGIIICGVTWLMDVKSVTRFEDPTRPTIQVRSE